MPTCHNTRLRKQLWPEGTPFRLAMTVLEEWRVNYFMLPFITLSISSRQKDP
jgi:hypothetical protein